MRQQQNLPHDFRSRLLSGGNEQDVAPSRDMQLWAQVERERNHTDYIIRMRMARAQERSIQIQEMGIMVGALVGICTAVLSAIVLISLAVLKNSGF